MRRTTLILGMGLMASLSLSACSKGDPAAAPSAAATDAMATITPGAQSVPEGLDNADGLQTSAEALKETGLAGIFEGKGSYTFFAPNDDAFAKLGAAGKQLTEGQDDAALAALLKGHIVPGYMTPQDLEAAIAASKDGKVSLTTLAGTTLVIRKSGNTISATSADGASATLGGTPVAGGASIAIPIEGVLKAM